MEIAWDKEENILTIDGVTYGSEQGDDGPVEVRVAILRKVTGRDLPPGVKVQSVRKVLGSFSELYTDPGNVYFERTPEGGVLVVEDLAFVDSDDEPDSARRAALIAQQIADSEAMLDTAEELGLVLSHDVSDIYDDEIAYITFRVPVGDVDRPVYEIVQDAPGSYNDLLQAGTAGAVVAVLRTLGLHQGPQPGLMEYVRRLVEATGHAPGDLRMDSAIGGGRRVDAILQPYETFDPLAVFEVKNRATPEAMEQAERGRSAVGAAATVLVATDLLVVRTPGGEARVVPADASLEDAETVLRLLSPSALTPARRPSRVEASESLRLVAQAISEAEEARTNEQKGQSYETLACLALELVPGVRVKYRKQRTDTSEIDIIAEYSGEPRNSMFNEYGPYILAECKNWSSPAAAKDLRDFHGKMQDCQVRLGVFFSRNGVTGAGDRDAVGVSKKLFHQQGALLVVIDLRDLRAVAAGEDFGRLLERRCDALRFQFA